MTCCQLGHTIMLIIPQFVKKQQYNGSLGVKTLIKRDVKLISSENLDSYGLPIPYWTFVEVVDTCSTWLTGKDIGQKKDYRQHPRPCPFHYWWISQCITLLDLCLLLLPLDLIVWSDCSLWFRTPDPD